MPMHPEVACAPVYKANGFGRDNKPIVWYWTSTKFGDGSFEVSPRKDIHKWELGLIQVDRGAYRLGIGTHLLNAFVRDVGPRRPVYGAIIHDETIDAAVHLGYVRDIGKIVITDKQMMNLPVVRLILSGGIDVKQVVLEYRKQKSKLGGPHHFRFSGVTQNIVTNFEIIDTTKF